MCGGYLASPASPAPPTPALPVSAHGLSHYLLGFSEEEHRRLMVQAELFDRITERAFVDAGITAGMRILDCGSGAGDVSLLAARLVGAGGHVLGLDQSPDSVARATRRAEAQGASNVTFEVAKLGIVQEAEWGLATLREDMRAAMLNVMATHLACGQGSARSRPCHRTHHDARRQHRRQDLRRPRRGTRIHHV